MCATASKSHTFGFKDTQTSNASYSVSEPYFQLRIFSRKAKLNSFIYLFNGVSNYKIIWKKFILRNRSAWFACRGHLLKFV